MLAKGYFVGKWGFFKSLLSWFIDIIEPDVVDYKDDELGFHVIFPI